MSGEQDQVRALAERIARRVAGGGGASGERQGENGGASGDDIAALRDGLSELRQRLVQIESRLPQQSDEQHGGPATSRQGEARGPQQSRPAGGHAGGEARPAASRTNGATAWLSGVYVPATHPSLERFGVDEAAVAELVDYFEAEKTCDLEPGGKACDHCAMCSSRGF